MKLTPRQRDVVALLDAGLTCPQIAERLGIAVKTVRRHVDDIAKRVPGELTPLKRIRQHASELINAA